MQDHEVTLSFKIFNLSDTRTHGGTRHTREPDTCDTMPDTPLRSRRSEVSTPHQLTHFTSVLPHPHIEAIHTACHRAAGDGFLDNRVPTRPPPAAGRLTLNT